MSAPGCLLHVVRGRPLTVHFSLVNGTDEDLRVPALLGPVGAFVRLEVADADGLAVHATERPKLKLKLDPAKPESYVTLRPGYSFGVVLELPDDELWLDPGDYLVRAVYENREFSLFGEQRCWATAELTV